MKPLVSVILPTYNTNHVFLKKSIDSILNQTYKNIELIIIDDASTNQTTEFITQRYSNRVILIRNETNKGISISLNKAISVSKGYFIARMDADDISNHRRIEEQVNYLLLNKTVSVLGTGITYFGFKKGIYIPPLTNKEIRSTLLLKSPFIHPTIMFRRELLYSYEYNKDSVAEDFDLWTRMALNHSINFSNLPKRLLFYRVHKNQITQKNSYKIRMNSNAIIHSYLDKIKFNLDDRTREAYFNLFLISGDKTYNEFLLIEKALLRILDLSQEVDFIDNSYINTLFSNRLFKLYLLSILKFKVSSKAIRKSILLRRFNIKYILVYFLSYISFRN